MVSPQQSTLQREIMPSPWARIAMFSRCSSRLNLFACQQFSLLTQEASKCKLYMMA